jgi:hypothetical protein
MAMEAMCKRTCKRVAGTVEQQAARCFVIKCFFLPMLANAIMPWHAFR